MTACGSELPELPTAVDPVCGRTVVQVDAPSVRQVHGRTYYFDSERCARQFDAGPEDYVRRVEKDRTLDSWDKDWAGGPSRESRNR
jgi:YHS domain-containing protein